MKKIEDDYNRQKFNLKYRFISSSLVKSIKHIISLKNDNSIYSLRHNIPKLNEDISIIKKDKDENFDLVFEKFVAFLDEFRKDLIYNELDLDFIKKLINN